MNENGKALTTIIKDRQSDINRLLGDKRVAISEISHSSTAQLLFAEGYFSKTIKVRNVSQKCWARGCKSCRIMDTGSMVARKILTVNNRPITLDRTLNWKSANVICLFIGKHCCSEQGTPDYYFGRTMDKLHERINGDRTHKNFEYKKSALYKLSTCLKKTKDHFSENLEKLHLRIIKSTRPQDLERAED